MKSVDREWIGDEVPRVSVLVHWCINKVINIFAKMLEHLQDVAEKVPSDFDLKIDDIGVGQQEKSIITPYLSVSFLQESVVKEHVISDEASLEFLNFCLSFSFRLPGGPGDSVDGSHHMFPHQVEDHVHLLSREVARLRDSGSKWLRLIETYFLDWKALFPKSET